MGSYKFPDPNREKRKLKEEKLEERERAMGVREKTLRGKIPKISLSVFYLYLSTTEKQSKFHKVSFQYLSLVKKWNFLYTLGYRKCV